MHAHRRVVLTRTTEDNERLKAAAGVLDVEWLDRPCLSIRLRPPGEVDRARLSGPHAAFVFVSRHAVEGLFAGGAVPVPRVAVAVGPGTAAALAGREFQEIRTPSVATAEALAAELSSLVPEPGAIACLRGNLGDDAVESASRAAGHETQAVVVYDTLPVVPAPIDPGGPTLVVLASPSAVDAFAQASVSGPFRVLAIGPTTAAAVDRHGWLYDIAASSSLDGLVRSIRSWCASNPDEGV